MTDKEILQAEMILQEVVSTGVGNLTAYQKELVNEYSAFMVCDSTQKSRVQEVMFTRD